MQISKKRPYPAKDRANIGNRRIRRLNKYSEKRHGLQSGEINSKKLKAAKGEKIMQVLKQESGRLWSGKDTFNKSCFGLLSVHNRNLIDFANALSSHRNDGGNNAE